MKTTLLLGILAFQLSAVSQNPDVPAKGTNSIRKVDSSYTYQQSASNSPWQLSTKTVYQYNNENRVSQMGTWLYISSGLWQNQLLVMYLYDFDGYPTTILTKVFGVNSLLIENEYDDANNLLRQTLNDWISSAWVETAINTYEYDDNLMISRRYTQLPASNGNYMLITYTYDANRHPAKMLVENFENNQLIAKQQTVYECDPAGLVVSELMQEWNQNGWRDVLLADYLYDSHGNRVSTITSTWQNNAWLNLSRQLDTYKEGDLHTSMTLDTWDGSAWKLQSTTNWKYEADNFLNTMVWRSYDLIWGQLSADSTRYFAQGTLGEEEIAQSGTLLLYPNPGNGLVTLTGEMPLESVEVYNLAGEKVRTIVPTQRHKAQLDLTDQARGMYVVKAKSAVGVAVGKVVLK